MLRRDPFHKKANLISLILFTVLALFMTYPLIFNMGSAVKDVGDPLLNTWIIAWNVQKITTLDFPDIFNGNIFYPHKRTIAFSEFLLTQSLVALPILLASQNPIFAKNFVLLFSFITSGLGMYFLARYLTKNVLGGITAGIIYAFSPFMIDHLSHLQILTAGGMPLALLFLHKFFKSTHYKHLFLFALFFLLQTLANGYYGLYLSLFAGLYILFYLVLGKKFTDGRFWLKMTIFLIIVLTVLGPVILQYLTVRKEMGFIRGIGSYSNLTSFLATSPQNRIYGDITSRFVRAEGQLFPGIFAFLLAIIGIIYSIREKRRWKKTFMQTPAYFYIIMLLLSFLFTFGTNGPYVLLYKYVPGFKGIRVASRFHILVMFSLAIFAAFGIKAILSSLARMKKRMPSVIFSCIILLILVEYLSIPIPWKSVPAKADIPEVYKWLAKKEGDFAIVELPFPKPKEHTFRKEGPRLYYSTYHWKKLVNGYSGYYPPLYYELKRRWQRESLEQNIKDLKRLGVKYVIFHSSLYDEEELERIMQDISNLPEQIQFIEQLDEAYIYELAYFPEERKKVHLEVKPRFLPKDNWLADSNVNRGNVKYAVDGDITTRWHIRGREYDVFFIFDLGQLYHIKGISMKSGKNSYEYPRSYKVELSTNGVEWKLMAQVENAMLPLAAFLKPKDISLNIMFSPTQARYAKITNTEKKAENRWWSLYEIEFFE